MAYNVCYAPIDVIIDLLPKQLQSTLAISTSVISNNRLSRSEILVPVLT